MFPLLVWQHTSGYNIIRQNGKLLFEDILQFKKKINRRTMINIMFDI